MVENLVYAWTLGPMELVLLLVAALIIFGPRRLPEIGKAAGEAIHGFKNASTAPPPTPPAPPPAAPTEDAPKS
jgi:sec-independent protein translocase protein TatA